MMVKRIMIAALLIAGTGALLFAGGQEEEPVDPDRPFAGQEITALFMDATYGDFAEEIAERFEAEHGGTVNIVTAPFAALHDRIGLALRTGDDTYDVMSLASQWDGEFARWMTDLEPFIEDSPEFDSDDIMDRAWDQSGKFGGKTIGIPHAYTPRLISYRTDLVDGVPDTWDEFFEVAEEVHDPENDFYAFATPGAREQVIAIFNVALWSQGGRWADEDWNVTIDSPEARRALEITERVIELSDPAATGWNLPESDAAFLAGNAAFNFAWPTLGVTVHGDNPEESEIVGEWALDLFPEEDTGITVLSAWDIGIPEASQNKEMAWEFIKMYTSAEAQTEAFEEYTIMPPRHSFWNDPEVQDSPLAPHQEAEAIFWWRIPAGEASRSVLQDGVHSYIIGDWDMQRAIQYIEDGFEDALSENAPPQDALNIKPF